MEQQDRRKQLEREIQRGLDAKLFLSYLEREPYFKKLFEELDDKYTKELLGLKPTQTEEFSVLQAKRISLYEPMNMVHQDILIGEKATAEIELFDQGQSSSEGIL